MAVTSVQVVSPRSQPVRAVAQAESKIDKLISALQLAGSVAQLGINFQTITKNIDDAELAPLRKKKAELDILKAKGDLTKQQQDEVDRQTDNLNKFFAETRKGQLHEQQLAGGKTAQESAVVELWLKKRTQEAKKLQDPLLEGMSSTDRQSLAQISTASHFLREFKKRIGEGIPPTKAMGDNRATAARKIVTQMLVRYFSGAAASDKQSFWTEINLTQGGELQQFDSMLPQGTDTPEAATGKMEDLEKIFEGIAGSLAIKKDAYNDYVSRTFGSEPVDALPAGDILFATTDEDIAAIEAATSEKIENFIAAGLAVGRGVLGAGEGPVAGVQEGREAEQQGQQAEQLKRVLEAAGVKKQLGLDTKPVELEGLDLRPDLIEAPTPDFDAVIPNLDTLRQPQIEQQPQIAPIPTQGAVAPQQPGLAGAISPQPGLAGAISPQPGLAGIINQQPQRQGGAGLRELIQQRIASGNNRDKSLIRKA